MFSFAIISILVNFETLMINKENSNQVRILVILKVIRFAELAVGLTRVTYLLLLRPISNLQIQPVKEKASFLRSWLSICKKIKMLYLLAAECRRFHNVC